MNKRYLLVLTAVSMLALGACKKSKTEPTVTPPVVTPPTTTPTATRQQLSLDSIFLYAKEVYLWNDKLPTYEVFNPRQYTTQTTDAKNYAQALFEITKYSNPFEWTTGATRSKFSYVFDKANKNPVAVINPEASVDLEGNGNDVGLDVGFYGTTANYNVYVRAVEPNSPADKAGFVRGDKLTKINGIEYGTNYTEEKGIAILNAVENSVSVEAVRGVDGTTFSANLTKVSYASSPIYKSRIINADGKKIGYISYARFAKLTNPATRNTPASDTRFDPIFQNFATEGVTDLIIDLRYNGGGYVSTAEYLTNLIAPSGVSGVMFSEHFNSVMQSGNAKILANQPLLDVNNKVQDQNNDGKIDTYADVNYSVSANTISFSKTGPLTGVRNIVFIVAAGTASASELLINNLKPHVNVTLVGRKTYGKPVGFFPITIENKYDIYYSLFESKNSLGQGGYYSGMVPDYDLAEVPTGTAMFDFGNPNDVYIAKAVSVLAPNAKSVNNTTMSSVKMFNTVSSSNVIGAELSNKFNGMIENRFKLKN
ncbi:S41 family peptidase [Pedobacter sp. SL55]|uniref:S41 family peptidase n=1 Tax=Pedobacter sp. SL55 TaxID=2995161 RepID=UPI00226E9EBA|nr:S41 family peptidase [Pedobacter sp. SL55]WAC40299.1 S41 family peptidase [Pedobacter sp. SL55]